MNRGDFRIAVLISGSGSTLQNLIDRISDGRLSNVTIATVLSSRPDVQGVTRATNAGLPIVIIRRADFADVDAFSTRIADALDTDGVDLAVQAGWLCYWRLPQRWLGRVINIHPSLLPDFGGKGFYGAHVHKAVLAAGRTQSGATVHYVDNEYDHGPIIEQRACPVQPNDTPESLAARVAEIERELLPKVIVRIRDGIGINSRYPTN